MTFESANMNQEEFKARLRQRALARGIPMDTLDRLLPIICEARPFFAFPDSYKERDIKDLAQAVAAAQPSGEPEPQAAHCREVAEALWGLLDDIDTLSDQIKPSSFSQYAGFYQHVMCIVKKRHEHLKSDGHHLSWPVPPAPRKLNEHLPEQRLLLDVLMGCGSRGFPTGFKGESWGAVLLEVERLVLEAVCETIPSLRVPVSSPE